MFTERLALLPENPAMFCPCPPARERAAWEQLASSIRSTYVERGQAQLGKAFAPLTAQHWLLFSKTGDRAAFEELYFSRRRQLNDLIMAECMEYKGRFLSDILNGIWLLCEESGWQLPAHNAYERDAPALPLPDVTRPVLDLFACETGALLAMARFLLEDALSAVSPLLLTRIDTELLRRIVTPYLHTHFWWMGNADEPMCNWTSWCTQNVLLVLLCTPQSDETRRWGIQKAAYSLDCFLKDYADDGCCNEGAQYYSHAGLTLWGALEMLCAAAPDAFQHLWQSEKLHNLAAYIYHMHIAGPYYVNFADCSPLAGRRGAREFLFAKRTGNSQMAAFCAEDWRAAQGKAAPQGDIARINLFYLIVDAFCAAELSAYPKTSTSHAEIYYPSVGVFLARDNDYTLAVKAGGNADSHNHNDTGSITLYRHGTPLLIDIGVETYTKKTFSPQRYEIWTMQSAWHNLPTFDGVMQQDGAKFCAQNLSVQFEETQSSISMELAGAYPPAAQVTAYRRTITLEKGRRIVVREACEGAFRQALLSLLFSTKPTIGQTDLQVGGTRFGFSGITGAIQCEGVPITDPRLRIAWPEMIYRVQVPFHRELSWEISAL